MGLAGKRRIEELFERIVNHDSESAIKAFSTMWMQGKDPIAILGELFTLMRDALMLRVAPKGGSQLISGGHDLAVLKRFAARLTNEELCAGMETIQSALIAARASRSPRSSAELCLVTLCSSMLKLDMPDFNARLSRIEEQLARGEFSAVRTRRHFVSEDERNPDEELANEEEHDCEPEEPDSTLPWEQPAEEVEDLDFDQFREEQPEDVFHKEKRAEPVKETEIDSGEQAQTTAEGDHFWPELCSLIVSRLPIDMRIYPGDPGKLRGTLRGNVLTLEAESGFIFNRFNRAEILQKFSDCASEMTGHSVNTVLRELTETTRERRNLDELKAFPETRIIG